VRESTAFALSVIGWFAFVVGLMGVLAATYPTHPQSTPTARLCRVQPYFNDLDFVKEFGPTVYTVEGVPYLYGADEYVPCKWLPIEEDV
jgi:hypothetical protein